MTIVLFLVILAVLVFVHEFGHFAAAKIFGIRVDEFALGFPPRITSYKKGETTYALNWIPFGGYVKIFGEDPNEESINGADSARSLVNAARWKQIVILLAGICMNFVFAWLLISLSFHLGMLTSIDDQSVNNFQDISVMVTSVLPSSPAANAGLQEGDRILAFVEKGSSTAVVSDVQLQKMIAASKGQIGLSFLRGQTSTTTFLTATSSILADRKAIGITMDFVGIEHFGIVQSLWEGAKMTGSEIVTISVGIFGFIRDGLSGNSATLSEVTGPIGIATLVGQAQAIGFSYLLTFVAAISINLAILNLVPFPAFDGGRVFFVLIEAITRRRIKPAILNWINTIGFALVMLLMLVITYQDVLRLVH